MKDHCLELVEQKSGFNEKLNMLREYLQAYVLRLGYEQGLFRHTAFLGETALRFLFQLPRFSEDLDFSILDKDYSFREMMLNIKRELSLAGYQVAVTYNDENVVQNSWIKFENLMYEAGISPLPSQKFSIKIEVDTQPPSGAHVITEVVNKFFPIAFQAYDLPSLFAGKLHALLTRKYTKGRDFFDLGWYLSRWRGLEPNIELLQNALAQTGFKNEVPSRETWRKHLYDVLAKTDWNKVVEDVKSFLENPSDLKIFTKENVLNLLTRS